MLTGRTLAAVLSLGLFLLSAPSRAQDATNSEKKPNPYAGKQPPTNEEQKTSAATKEAAKGSNPNAPGEGSDDEWVTELNPNLKLQEKTPKQTPPEKGGAKPAAEAASSKAPQAKESTKEEERGPSKIQGPPRTIPSISVGYAGRTVSTSDPATKETVTRLFENDARARLIILWLTKAAEYFDSPTVWGNLFNSAQTDQTLFLKWLGQAKALNSNTSTPAPGTPPPANDLATAQPSPILENEKTDVFFLLNFRDHVTTRYSFQIAVCDRSPAFPKVCRAQLEVPKTVIDTALAMTLLPSQIHLGPASVYFAQKFSIEKDLEVPADWTPEKTPNFAQNLANSFAVLKWWLSNQILCRSTLIALKEHMASLEIPKVSLNFNEIAGLEKSRMRQMTEAGIIGQNTNLFGISSSQCTPLAYSYLTRALAMLRGSGSFLRKLQDESAPSDRFQIQFQYGLRDALHLLEHNDNFCVSSSSKLVPDSCRERRSSLPRTVLESALISQQGLELHQSEKQDVQTVIDYVNSYAQRLNWNKLFKDTSKNLGD